MAESWDGYLSPCMFVTRMAPYPAMENALPPATSRFRIGIALAWIPLVFFAVGFGNAFRGIASNKATGIGAVAGGLGEAMALFGFFAFLAAQIAAITILVRSFSKNQTLRNAVALVSVLCCGFALLIVAGSAWAVWYLLSMRH